MSSFHRELSRLTASIREALLEELHHLESAFNCYVLHEVSENEQYALKATSLFREICCDSEKLDRSGDPESITLLNFNYTEPLSSAVHPGSNVVEFNQINVHGSLGHEQIIGIDGSRCLSEAGLVRFSKTFRLLQLHEPSIRGAIAYPANTDVCGGMKTVAVKFFGHSMAPADYSYFQSIFDTVDLYSSDVTLCFYYTAFKENALDELLVNIANLLGNTADPWTTRAMAGILCTSSCSSGDSSLGRLRYSLPNVVALASKFTPWFNSFDMQSYLWRFDYVWFPSGLAEFTWAYVAFGIAFAIWFQRVIGRGVAVVCRMLCLMFRCGEW